MEGSWAEGAVTITLGASKVPRAARWRSACPPSSGDPHRLGDRGVRHAVAGSRGGEFRWNHGRPPQHGGSIMRRWLWIAGCRW